MLKHAPFYISSSYNWGIKSIGVLPQYCKSHNFCHFTDVLLGYKELKSCNFLSFLVIFMKSSTIILQILSKHIIIVILHF